MPSDNTLISKDMDKNKPESSGRVCSSCPCLHSKSNHWTLPTRKNRVLISSHIIIDADHVQFQSFCPTTPCTTPVPLVFIICQPCKITWHKYTINNTCVSVLWLSWDKFMLRYPTIQDMNFRVHMKSLHRTRAIMHKFHNVKYGFILEYMNHGP